MVATLDTGTGQSTTVAYLVLSYTIRLLLLMEARVELSALRRSPILY